MEPSLSVRKPLRARKTMTPSSRKQVAMLHRAKGIGEPGRTASAASLLADPSLRRPPPPLVIEPETDLAAGSEVGVRGGPRGAAQEPPKTTADVEQFLSAGALQDLLYQLYESEPSFWPPKPVEVCLDLVPAGCSLDSPEGLPFPPASAANHTPQRDEKGPPPGGLTPVVSEQESGGSLRHKEAASSSVPLDEAPRKRRKLESAEGAPRGAGQDGSAGGRRQNNLENVKAFVQGHLDAAVGALDRGLQATNWRLESIQCLRRHEGVALNVQKRTSKLEKRVNAMSALWTQLSKKMKLLGSGAPNKILNGCRSLPDHANPQPTVPPPKTTSAGSKASPPVAKSLASSPAPPRAAESSDDVVCLEMRPPGVPPAKASGVPQDGTPNAAAVSASTPDNRKEKLVIDLTEEGSGARAALGEEAAAAASGKAVAAPESLEADLPQPLLPSPKEVAWERVHLPPLPKVHLLPGQLQDFRGTAPPQRLLLTVVKLLHPQGLALQWDVRQEDGRCARLDSFHLFFFVDSASTPFSWTRMKVIKALPLPMFISLGALPASGTYYFTMQSKDVYGRYGPFSEVQSASVP